MPSPSGPIALIYDDDAYVEPAAGLMGRQVAGGGFLDAYLAHGRWDELVALVKSVDRVESLKRICREHPSSRSRARRLRVVEESRFLEDFGDLPPSRLIHAPGPPEAKHAWARHQIGGHGFALCGLTHTLASVAAIGRLRDLLIAPFQPYDALICTSTAVEATVRAVVDDYASYLKDRFGGDPRLGVHLATIPLGVDTDRHRPATVEERAEQRTRMGIGEEFVVLCVGRLSHHAKAHPYPLYRALDLAAATTGQPIRLVMSGWAASTGTAEAFRRGARLFAPRVVTEFVDGTDPAVRDRVWHAADAFAMLADSVQETFGLAVVEAMARGLPVVATDWDGHRDTVVDGETGLLVPTAMVRGATLDSGARLDLGAVDYDMYLAEVGQAVIVDIAAAASAFAGLIVERGRAASMGASGRRRAVAEFAWPGIITRYEALWAWQEGERSAQGGPIGPGVGGRHGPPERVHAAYPSRWLDDEARVVAAASAIDRLASLLAEPLTHHAAGHRVSDPSTLSGILGLAADPTRAGGLLAALRSRSVGPVRAAATLAWLLKYDLLRLASVTEEGG